MTEPVVMLGEDEQGGAYVLRLAIARPLAVRFGHFQGGALIDVPAGEALYVGSAMAQRGPTTLARRLLRHASRSGEKPPQSLREEMLSRFLAAGLGPPTLAAPAEKRPLWHIDFLVDEPEVTLQQVFVVRSAVPLELAIADMIAADPAIEVIAPGLGAQDRRGKAHLLTVRAQAAWWVELPPRLEALHLAAAVL